LLRRFAPRNDNPRHPKFEHPGKRFFSQLFRRTLRPTHFPEEPNFVRKMSGEAMFPEPVLFGVRKVTDMRLFAV
jgi:hypothetical protein